MSRTRRSRATTDPAPSTVTTTADLDLNLAPGYQWHEPLSAEDRAEAHLLAVAYSLGYRLSVRCLDCNRPLTEQASIKAHRGPTCRKRAAEAVAE